MLIDGGLPVIGGGRGCRGASPPSPPPAGAVNIQRSHEIAPILLKKVMVMVGHGHGQGHSLHNQISCVFKNSLFSEKRFSDYL